MLIDKIEERLKIMLMDKIEGRPKIMSMDKIEERLKNNEERIAALEEKLATAEKPEERLKIMEERIAAREEKLATAEKPKVPGITWEFSKVPYCLLSMEWNWVVDQYQFDDNDKVPYLETRKFINFSDGRMGYLNFWDKGIANTRSMADMFGYQYDSKERKPEVLGHQLVSTYGDGTWAFIGNYGVNAAGLKCSFIETSMPYHQKVLNFALGKDGRLKEFFENDSMEFDSTWTPEQIAEKLNLFIQTLRYRKKP